MVHQPKNFERLKPRPGYIYGCARSMYARLITYIPVSTSLKGETADIFPDFPAPILRNSLEGRESVGARALGYAEFITGSIRGHEGGTDRLHAKGEQVDFTALLKMETDLGTSEHEE